MGIFLQIPIPARLREQFQVESKLTRFRPNAIPIQFNANFAKSNASLNALLQEIGEIREIREIGEIREIEEIQEIGKSH